MSAMSARIRYSFIASLIAAAFMLTASLITGGQAQAATTTFSNPATITIPHYGNANPYPSTINVSGVVGSITDVNVILNDYSHTCFREPNMLLVAPSGQAVALATSYGGCGTITNIDVTFDDSASQNIPGSAAAWVSGSYRPTDNDPGYSFPGAPARPYAANLAALNGSNPNGTWSLYIFDRVFWDQGTIVGWSLEITASVPAAPAATAEPTIPPIIDDSRANPVSRHPAQAAAIYCSVYGIDVYAVHDGEGVFAFRATPEMIEAFGIPVEDAAIDEMLIAEGLDVRLYRLPTGEFQVNAPVWDDVTGWDYNGYVFIWEGCNFTETSEDAGQQTAK